MSTGREVDFNEDGASRNLEESNLYSRNVQDWIRNAAEHGIYDIRGMGSKRDVPHFDDLTFLTGSASRYPLEGYREKCTTDTVLGSRYAKKPLHLDIPITFAGMSFGSLSANVKEALGRAATSLGTSTTTGDGGMTQEERNSSKTLVYQCLPSRYGFNPDDLRQADAVEVVIGQGAKPGGGGMLLGQKISARVAEMRTLPPGIDQRSASRHPDWTGPDDLTIKIEELREVTDWGDPGLRQDRSYAGRQRRQAGGKGRGGRGGRGRDAGRHRRHPGRVHRARWHSNPVRRHPGGGGSGGSGHDGRGSARRLRRHPHRGRRGQGAGSWGRRGLDRPGGDDRPGL